MVGDDGNFGTRVDGPHANLLRAKHEFRRYQRCGDRHQWRSNTRSNQLTGPGLNTVNLSLGKTFAIWEQVHLQIRADANNAFNHASFGLPSGSLSVNGSGGIATGTSTITSTTVPGRTVQLSGRLTF